MARASLRGKVAVITGAGSGIGRALAHELDRRGCRLALSDIDGEAAQRTAAGCRDARAYHLDVRDRAAVAAHADAVLADFGRIELVVNNAGVALTADATEQSFEDLDWVLDVNLKGVVNGTQILLPHLIASGRGHLVNISSLFGIVGIPAQSAYNASKFGVRGFTEAVAIEMEVAGHPVSVHCVHPGGIRTNIANNARVAAGRRHDVLADFFNSKLAMTSAEDAARAIVRAVERGRRRVLVGPDAKAIYAMERLLGSGYQRLVARAVRSTPIARGAQTPHPHHLRPVEVRDTDRPPTSDESVRTG